MRQFLAIMKDSYREARDAKIIYVMLVFAFLMIMLTFSISFRQETLQQTVDKHFDPINFVLGFAKQPGQKTPPKFVIENFRQSNDTSIPWQGNYAWDLVLKFNTATDKKAAVEAGNVAGIPLGTEFFQIVFTTDKFYFLKNVTVRTGADAADEIRYVVTTEGTKIDNANAWPHEITILFGLIPFGIVGGTGGNVNEAVYNIEKWGVQQFGSWTALLIGVVITSFFVPNMLRKGTVDLYISKPIDRVRLLIFKYVGGLIFMLILTSVTVVGIWLALGLRSGIWGLGFLWVVPGLMFYFAVLYAVSVLAGVLTRSPIVCILVTTAAWGVFFANGYIHTKIEDAQRELEKKLDMSQENEEPGMRPQLEKLDMSQAKKEPGKRPRRKRISEMGLPDVPKWAIVTSEVVNFVLPRTYEVDYLVGVANARSVLSKAELERKGIEDAEPRWVEILGISSAFIGILLGLACWRFSKFEP
jgi:ABC-type transport system involved in multi-copper enzyme maturation permease subunit